MDEKLKQDIQRIIIELQDLQKDSDKAGETREEISQDVDKIAEHVEDIKKEMDETGEDVEDIKEDVEDIKKEVDETGEDVEDIKGDIEDIKKHLGELKQATNESFLSKVAHKVLPSEFAIKDVAQQVVGAMVLSAPFTVTSEVWGLAKSLDAVHIGALVFLTLLFDILLFYFTSFHEPGGKKFFKLPLRIFSLIAVTYITTTIVLSAFGVIGGEVTEPIWAIKLVIMVGLFANIGAGTADLIK